MMARFRGASMAVSGWSEVKVNAAGVEIKTYKCRVLSGLTVHRDLC